MADWTGRAPHRAAGQVGLRTTTLRGSRSARATVIRDLVRSGRGLASSGGDARRADRCTVCLRRGTERCRRSGSDRRRKIGRVSHHLSRPLSRSRKHARAVQRAHPMMARRTGEVTAVRPCRWPAGRAATLFIAAGSGYLTDVATLSAFRSRVTYGAAASPLCGHARQASISFAAAPTYLSISRCSIQRSGMHPLLSRCIWRAMD